MRFAWFITLVLTLLRPTLGAEPTLTAEFAPASLASGANTTLKLTLVIPPGFHTYAPSSPEGGALVVKYDESAGLTATGELRFPKPHVRFEQLLKGLVHELEGTIVLEQDFVAPATGGTVRGALDLQYCDKRQCTKKLMPFSATFDVKPSEGAAAPAQNVGAGLGAAFGSLPGIGGGTDRAKLHGAKFEPATAAPGSTVELVLDLEVMPGYHAYAPTTPSEYALKLEVALPEGSPFSATKSLATPEPKVHVDEALGETFHELAGRFVARQSLRVPSTGTGKLAFKGTLSGQACDESTCENFDFPLDLTLTVEGEPVTPVANEPAPRAADPGASGTDTSASGAKRAEPESAAGGTTQQEQSLLSFLLTAIGAGILSLMMPCVFPMIPITISVFTKQAAGSRAASIRLAAIYGLSIIIVFTAIGVLCSVILGSSGANQIGSNPWVNTVLGALFVVFGLSLLGAFELRLPSFLIQGAAGAQQKATGVVQVILMAVVFTLTSFTCTVPFVGALLVQASTGDYLWPFLGMLAFSSTFALPFFLLALAPTLLGSLPSAGNWMNTAKVTMGLVEFAFALKFFSNADLVWNLELLTRPNYLSAWVVIGLVTTLYLLGRLRVGYDLNDEPIGPYRVVVALLCGWTTLYLATGFLGTRFGETIEGLLPPSNYGVAAASTTRTGGGESGPAHAELTFHDTYAVALEVARREKKPLFVDFTGVTCVNCRAMEETVFPRDDVRPYLERMVRVQLYVDKKGTPELERNSEFNAKLQVDRFQNAAQPYYAVIDPTDERTLGTFPGYAGTEELVAEFVAMLAAAEKSFAKN